VLVLVKHLEVKDEEKQRRLPEKHPQSIDEGFAFALE
jgi:hypothetical protein